MESSNTQLEEFARENDDRDCYEALLENRQVIKRFEERLDALKKEVTEVRGLPWRPREEEGGKVEEKAAPAPVANGVNGTGANADGGAGAGPPGGNEEEGVFL